MRIARARGVLLVALSMVAGAKGDEQPEPSPIPEKLQQEAKKAFDSATNGSGDFKGTVEVSIYLIKEVDQVKEEKALAISNTVKVKVKFE